MSGKIPKLLIALALTIFGILAITSYQLILSIILNAALLFSFLNGMYRIWMGVLKKNTMDLAMGIVSLFFGTVLLFYNFIPEWLIRVCFGAYCMFVGGSILVQQGIYMYNEIRTPITGWIFSFAYFLLGFLLLFSPQITTKMLMQSFGVYFLLLALRYGMDAFEITDTNYKWHRFIHISLPTALLPFIPDYYMNKINRIFQNKERVETRIFKRDEEPKLKAMVHVGPEGMQKVGHFSFSYKDIVYSYGNYDADSAKFGGLMGDGVYFTVPFSQYLPNIRRYEQNTIFEYGIHISGEQEKQIEEALEQLANNSYRWYSKIEKDVQIANIKQYEQDYPCRLHYRTGAKFYKIKKGKFRTYWATGENCVLFADQILGVIGADVLSVRGIVSPGTYFDYLQSEYEKENSPIITRVIHPSLSAPEDEKTDSSS